MINDENMIVPRINSAERADVCGCNSIGAKDICVLVISLAPTRRCKVRVPLFAQK